MKRMNERFVIWTDIGLRIVGVLDFISAVFFDISDSDGLDVYKRQSVIVIRSEGTLMSVTFAMPSGVSIFAPILGARELNSLYVSYS